MSIRIASWLAAAGCALALAGCGGDSEETTTSGPVIPARIAEDLAAQSDRIADLLAESKTCDAAVAADGLLASFEESAERIPDTLEEEVRTVANELVNNVNCQEPEDEEKDDEEKGKGEEKDKGKGNGNGNGGEGSTDTTTVVVVTTE